MVKTLTVVYKLGPSHFSKIKKIFIRIQVLQIDEKGLQRYKKPIFSPLYSSQNKNMPVERSVKLSTCRKHFCIFEKLYSFIGTKDRENREERF